MYNQKNLFELSLFKPIDSGSELILKLNKIIKFLEKDNDEIKNDLIALNDIVMIKDILSELLSYTNKISDFSVELLFYIYKKYIEEEKLNISLNIV